jgi:predicted GIY-YIG superfamily endonuclease/Fe2+ or Zn2+ uptake regulation protein
MFYLYKIQNTINNKIYIGQTINFRNRMIRHKSTSENKNEPLYESYLYRSIRKHKWENFSKEIIDTAKNQEEANEKEEYYIEKYNSYNNGYNCTKGGNCRAIKTQKELEHQIKIQSKNFWKITFPNKNVVIINSLEDFSRKNNLDANGLRKVAKSKIKHHRGFLCQKLITIKEIPLNEKEDLLIKINKIDNITQEQLFEISNGHLSFDLNFKYKDNLFDPKSDFWEIIFPTNEVKYVLSLDKFCKENNLIPESMRLVNKGEIKHHHNYKCKKLNKTVSRINVNDIKEIISNLQNNNGIKLTEEQLFSYSKGYLEF